MILNSILHVLDVFFQTTSSEVLKHNFRLHNRNYFSLVLEAHDSKNKEFNNNFFSGGNS